MGAFAYLEYAATTSLLCTSGVGKRAKLTNIPETSTIPMIAIILRATDPFGAFILIGPPDLVSVGPRIRNTAPYGFLDGEVEVVGASVF